MDDQATGRTRPDVPCQATITIEEGHGAGLSYVVDEFPVILGRGSQADIRLPDDPETPTLSRQHVRLHLRGGRLYIEDMSTTGTRLGTRELFPREVTAATGEAIWLGPRTRLSVTLSIEVAPPPTDTRPTLEVRCLGGFSVTANGQDVPEALWESRKASLLMALLGEARTPLSSERLTDALWSDAEDGGRAALQTTISRIRRVFRKMANLTAFPDPVVFSQGKYSVNPGCALHCDVTDFEACCAQAGSLQTAGQWDDSLWHVDRALALYRGAYLEGFSADWIDLRRTTLAGRHAALLERLAGWHEGCSRLEDAQHTFERLLAADPCHDVGRRGVMRCLLGLGKREEAIRHYQEGVRTLRRMLDLEPSPAMTALYDSIV